MPGDSKVKMMSTLDSPKVILHKLRAIRAELAAGVYDAVQVVGIASAVEVFLDLANSKPNRRITKNALYDAANVSKSVFSKVVSLRHVPRMENFFPIVDGLIGVFEQELGLASISLDALQGVPARYISAAEIGSGKLTSLCELLVELVDKIKASNSGVGGLLGELERVQLIAILETTLCHLKSPEVEVGSLKKLRHWLQDLASKSLKKGGETMVGVLAGNAAQAITGVLKGLF